MNSDNYKKHLDENQQSVYAYSNNQWIGFDNKRSIALKVKWAYTMNLGGTFLWTLDFDDYSSKFCNEGPFPLANAIKAVFDEYSPSIESESTTKRTTTTSTTTTTTTTTIVSSPTKVPLKNLKKIANSKNGNNVTLIKNNDNNPKGNSTLNNISLSQVNQRKNSVSNQINYNLVFFNFAIFLNLLLSFYLF